MTKLSPMLPIPIRAKSRSRGNRASSDGRTRSKQLETQPLEDRLLLTEFVSHIPDLDGDVDRPTDVYVADLDGDGDGDVVSASTGKIAWYENTGGLVRFGPQQVITTRILEPTSVFVADIDADGDADVVSASYDAVAWFENLDGTGNFAEQQIISNEVSFAQDVFAIDLDGDSDLDVLSASSGDNKVAWYENIDGKGGFGEQEIIQQDISVKGLPAWSVYAADLDGDGDQDVVSAFSRLSGNRDNMITWFQNRDGTGSFGPQQVISRLADGARSVFAADLDRDGDVDVLSASFNDRKIAWYENADGQGSFGRQRIISRDVANAQAVFAADVDQDGDVDVFAASSGDHKIALYRNADGDGRRWLQTIISGTAHGASSVFAADLDGDGDLDAVAAAETGSTVKWYEYADNHRFQVQQRISGRARFDGKLVSADVDGDGDMDVISSSLNEGLGWNANTDGQGSWGPRLTISSSDSHEGSISVADVDRDGDTDIVTTLAQAVVWHENTDGKGNYSEAQSIATVNRQGTVDVSVHTADIDGDGDIDVVSSYSYGAQDGVIDWHENIEGSGEFAPPQRITSFSNLVESTANLFAADLNGDGTVDVLSDRAADGQTAWYENLDGNGQYGPPIVITSTRPSEQPGPAFSRLVGAADVDNDGDQDVISSGRRHLSWYKNLDGKGTFGEEQSILSLPHGWYASSFLTFDPDNDGDIDIGVVERSFTFTRVAWYENGDGANRFGSRQLIVDKYPFRSIIAADVNGDGDTDVLSALVYRDGVRPIWFENVDSMPREVGDANGDGSFNQLDIVTVLQAGKYLSGEKADWHEGDWNEDGMFDQLDIVVTLARGNYRQSPADG